MIMAKVSVMLRAHRLYPADIARQRRKQKTNSFAKLFDDLTRLGTFRSGIKGGHELYARAKRTAGLGYNDPPTQFEYFRTHHTINQLEAIVGYGQDSQFLTPMADLSQAEIQALTSSELVTKKPVPLTEASASTGVGETMAIELEELEADVDDLPEVEYINQALAKEKRPTRFPNWPGCVTGAVLYIGRRPSNLAGENEVDDADLIEDAPAGIRDAYPASQGSPSKFSTLSSQSRGRFFDPVDPIRGTDKSQPVLPTASKLREIYLGENPKSRCQKTPSWRSRHESPSAR